MCEPATIVHGPVNTVGLRSSSFLLLFHQTTIQSLFRIDFLGYFHPLVYISNVKNLKVENEEPTRAELSLHVP